MGMYSFVPPFRKTKFCGVPSCVFEKLGCAADEDSLRDAAFKDQHWAKGSAVQGPYVVLWVSRLSIPSAGHLHSSLS